MRPDSTTCEVCGLPVPQAARGRIGYTHAGCRDLRNDLDRLWRSVDVAVAGMPYDGKRAVRKRLFREMFHAINATFNGKAPTAPAGETTAAQS